MDENSSLPIIEENEKILSTMIISIESNNKVTTLDVEEKEKKQEEIILQTADKNSSSYDEIIISSIINSLLTEVESNRNNFLPFNEEKQDNLKLTTRKLRSHVRGKFSNQISNHN